MGRDRALPPFRPRPDHELANLSDEALLAYAVAARAAGASADAARGLQHLAFGYEPIVRLRVARKVPAEWVEDVAGAALVRAVAAALREDAFTGEAVGQFRKWLHTIVDREIADWYRRREREPPAGPLPSGGDDDDDGPWGPEPMAADERGAVEVQDTIDRALGELSPRHREIVERYVLGDESAADVASSARTSENNVHQIASRFRKRVSELLDP